jgi:hypothetical protein
MARLISWFFLCFSEHFEFRHGENITCRLIKWQAGGRSEYPLKPAYADGALCGMATGQRRKLAGSLGPVLDSFNKSSQTRCGYLPSARLDLFSTSFPLATALFATWFSTHTK